MFSAILGKIPLLNYLFSAFPLHSKGSACAGLLNYLLEWLLGGNRSL